MAGLGWPMGCLALLFVAACNPGTDDADIPWDLTVDTIRSDMDGSVRLRTALMGFGKEGPEGFPRTETAILRFNCDRGRTLASLLTDQTLNPGPIGVRLKLDTLPPRILSGWAGSPSRDPLILFTDDFDTLFSSLSGRQRVLLEYSTTNGSSKTIAEFATAGISPLHAPFLEACAKR